MLYQFCCRWMLILVLLNFYCYASPVPSTDHNPEEEEEPSVVVVPPPHESHEQSEIKEAIDIDLSGDKPPTTELNEAYYLRILCALYGSCNDDDEQITDYDEKKQKRLSSRLFHGFPKFGKRAFSSAFSGIPKFG